MSEIKMYTLLTARNKVGLTQQEAAKTLGCSPDTLRNYESGKTQPDVSMIKKMEKLYGVTFRQLIFLTDDNG